MFKTAYQSCKLDIMWMLCRSIPHVSFDTVTFIAAQCVHTIFQMCRYSSHSYILQVSCNTHTLECHINLKIHFTGMVHWLLSSPCKLGIISYIYLPLCNFFAYKLFAMKCALILMNTFSGTQLQYFSYKLMLSQLAIMASDLVI